MGSFYRISDSEMDQAIQTNQINLKAPLFLIRSKGLDKKSVNSVDSGERPENPKKLFSILDLLEQQDSEDATLVNIVNVIGGTVQSKKLWSLSLRNMIFKSKQCRVLQLRDVSMIRENVRLANSNKMMSLVQSSINHEMLTPIKCIIQTVSTFKHNFSEPHFDKDANLVICTAQMLQNQVKGNLDRNLLEQNEFTPQLGFVYL